MSERWIFALLAAFFAGEFAYGMWAGRMPARLFIFDRHAQPTLFWFTGAFWLLLAVVCVAAAVIAP